MELSLNRSNYIFTDLQLLYREHFKQTFAEADLKFELKFGQFVDHEGAQNY